MKCYPQQLRQLQFSDVMSVKTNFQLVALAFGILLFTVQKKPSSVILVCLCQVLEGTRHLLIFQEQERVG